MLFFYSDIKPLDETAHEEARNFIFEQFWKHACLQFRFNGTVYLRGLKVPDIFASLLPPKTYSNYSSIEWVDQERPSTQDFTLSNAGCSEEEIADHTKNVESILRNVLSAYNADEALQS